MIQREDAVQLLYRHLTPHNLRMHCLATGRVMEALATHLGQDQEQWYLTGLLHDIDLDYTSSDFSHHGIKAMELLAEAGLTEAMKQAIRAHSGNEPVVTLLDQALWAVDPVTGLVTATAYMMPDRKISSVADASLKKKFKTKGFAAGASREQIAACEKVGISLDEFLALARKAMADHEVELGF